MAAQDTKSSRYPEILYDVAAFFRHPLVLAVAGAIITGLLVPYITNGWQDHQRQLDLKNSLVSQISEHVARMVVAVQFVEFYGFSHKYLTPEVFDKNYEDWTINSQVLDTKLDAYYPGTTVGPDWFSYSQLVTLLYQLTAVENTKTRKQIFAAMKKRLSPEESALVDWKGLEKWQFPLRTARAQTAWYGLRDQILDRKNAITQEILSSSITAA